MDRKLGRAWFLRAGYGERGCPHPHIHCVVPGGGLSPNHPQWIRAPHHFFLPVRVWSRVFRGKFMAGLRRAFRRDQLVFCGSCPPLMQEKAFSAFLRTLFRQDWVVYAKKPFGGPQHLLHYLARYTHCVAISNPVSYTHLDVYKRQMLNPWLAGVSSIQRFCADSRACASFGASRTASCREIVVSSAAARFSVPGFTRA